MSFADHLSRMDAAIVTHLTDGQGVYHEGATVLPNIPYLIDRDYQIYDDNQLPQVVTSLSIPSSTVIKSRAGDRFTAADGKVWKIHQTLEDDGHWRRLYVS